jgi:hypothetical protein
LKGEKREARSEKRVASGEWRVASGEIEDRGGGAARRGMARMKLWGSKNGGVHVDSAIPNR